MLPFYAERFNTTEVNYTFHRIPAPKTIANWCQLTPETFRFTLKAPKKVTHFARLRNCGDTVDYFYDVVSGLDSRLGPVLFQLPPNLRRTPFCSSISQNRCRQVCGRLLSFAMNHGWMRKYSRCCEGEIFACALPTPKSWRRQRSGPPIGVTCVYDVKITKRMT